MIKKVIFFVLCCFMLLSCPPEPGSEQGQESRVAVDDFYITELNSVNTYVGDVSTQLSITIMVTPNIEENKIVNWSTGNEAVATVVNGLVTPVSVGTTQITAISAVDESWTDSRNLTVLLIGVDSISLNIPTHTIAAYEGRAETVQLVATVVTDPVKPSLHGVTWLSSAPKIARVTDGLVTGLTDGTATITVTSTHDTSKFATCEITVQKTQPANMSVDTTALSALSLTYWNQAELNELASQIPSSGLRGDSLKVAVKKKIENTVTLTTGEYSAVSITIDSNIAADGITFSLTDNTDAKTISNLILPVTLFAVPDGTGATFENSILFKKAILGATKDLAGTILDSSNSEIDFNAVKEHTTGYSVIVAYKAPSLVTGTIPPAGTTPIFEYYASDTESIHAYISERSSPIFETNVIKGAKAGFKFSGSLTLRQSDTLAIFNVINNNKMNIWYKLTDNGGALYASESYMDWPGSKDIPMTSFYDSESPFAPFFSNLAPTKIQFGGEPLNTTTTTNYGKFVANPTLEIYFIGIVNTGTSTAQKTALTTYVRTIMTERR